MPLADLNVDVLVEIFAQYLFITSNGQATLMLVCSTWKEIVTNTARLWTRITIKDADPNRSVANLWTRVPMEDATQFDIAVRMSKDLPLTIVLLDFFCDMTTVKPYINRIESIVIKLHRHVFENFVFEVVCWGLETLSGYRGHVEWVNNDGPFYAAPDNLFVFIWIEGEISVMDSFRGIRGTFMTDFTFMENITGRVSLKVLWEYFTLLPNLARLRLAASCIEQSSGPSPPTVHFPHLQELHLFASIKETKNNPPISFILLNIRSKSLRLVRLEGPSQVVADLTTLLEFTTALDELYLRFTIISTVPSGIYRAESGKSQWPIKLTVDLVEIRNPSLSETVTCLQPLLPRIKRLSSCNFIVDNLPGDIEEAPEILGCPITLSHPDSYQVTVHP